MKYHCNYHILLLSSSICNFQNEFSLHTAQAELSPASGTCNGYVPAYNFQLSGIFLTLNMPALLIDLCRQYDGIVNYLSY
jgi:hypothetical protein